MRDSLRFLLLAALLSFGVAIYFLSYGSAGIAVYVVFLFISLLVVLSQVWKMSSFPKFFSARMKKTTTKDNLSKANFIVKNATSGRVYGQREVAKILREGLLNKYLGNGSYPLGWVSGSSGDAAIQDILRSLEKLDLTSVFDLPEIPAPHKLPRGERYFSKLEKALTMIE